MPSATPEIITEDEEVERLAGLQLRDRLIKGLGMFEQIEQLLQKKAIPPPHLNPSQQLATHSDPGMHGKSISHTSLPSQVQLPPTSSSLTSVMTQSFALLHQQSTLPLQRYVTQPHSETENPHCNALPHHKVERLPQASTIGTKGTQSCQWETTYITRAHSRVPRSICRVYVGEASFQNPFPLWPI